MNQKGSVSERVETFGRIWRFADYEFNELGRELRGKGKPIELESKPLEILLQLLLHAGEVVTKEELLESVWPDVIVVDGSLATAVSKLRKAMGDEDHPAIVTVPRVGYRLAVPVYCQTIAAAAGPELGFKAGGSVPGREQWRLSGPMEISGSSEVWLAENPKTHEQRVFKFAADAVRLKGLKREITISRFLRESLGDRPEFVRILEWNFEIPPFFLESEYSGPNLAEWAEMQGGLSKLSHETRLQVLVDVAKAVADAHSIGVLHKDLKPANILVVPASSRGWQIKVADFGSASLFDPSRLQALGITNLGFTQTASIESHAALTGTLMYLAPEVLAGQSPSAEADVYALGVILYQLIIGDFRKPLAPGWEAAIQDPLLREDIAVAACGDPARRLKTAAELAERLTNLDRRRAERKQQAEAARRRDLADRRRAQVRARIPWILLAAVLLVAAGIALPTLRKKPALPASRIQTVAVLPFQNLGANTSVDFLRLVLPDEIATALSYVHPLSIRASATTRKYDSPNLDPQKAGKELGVSVVITGHFLTQQNQLQLTYEAVDVADNHILWRDTIVSPVQNLIDARQKMYQQAQSGLAVALGARGADGSNLPATVPANEEAYDLYSRAVMFPSDFESNRKAMQMLERVVQMDPGYAPYWLALGGRYYNETHYLRGNKTDELLKKTLVASERAVELDPHYGAAQYGLAIAHAEHGELLEGYRAASKMLRELPGNEISPFAMSYVLRYTGLEQEAEAQCEIARSFDRQNSAMRSCGVAFLEHGDYDKARVFFNLDADTDWNHALTIDVLLREGKEQEALQIRRPQIGAWTSYDMLLACAAHEPAAEIAALAKRIEPDDDPESNYFAASHLAYCGQTEAALDLLRRTVKANYCAYPAMDTDPMFASIRTQPDYTEIRAAGKACQANFLAGRAKMQ